MQLPGRWRARMAVVVTGVTLAAVLATSGPAGAASSDESRLLSLTNGLRASVGAPALTLDESLSAVARSWAAKMAADGTISHNPSLTIQVGSWSKVAENVGMGPDVDTVHRALVASPSHYANLVDTGVTLVGIGVVTSGRYVFAVENFVLRRGGPAPPQARAPSTTGPPLAAPAPAPPTTARRATVAPARTPVTSAPTTVPATAPAVAPAPHDALSPWFALALEMTRGWERATG